MNKEEILKRSRAENMDEREEQIESKSSEIAFSCILGVYAVLILFSSAQRFITGESFIDYGTLVLAILVGLTGKYFTKYCYTKERSFFIFSIIGVIASVVYLGLVIIEGLGIL